MHTIIIGQFLFSESAKIRQCLSNRRTWNFPPSGSMIMNKSTFLITGSVDMAALSEKARALGRQGQGGKDRMPGFHT